MPRKKARGIVRGGDTASPSGQDAGENDEEPSTSQVLTRRASAAAEVEVLGSEELSEARLKCPYTMLPLTEPMKNVHKKLSCIHHISKQALLAIAKKGPKGAVCPVAGCSGRWFMKYAELDTEYQVKIQEHLAKKSSSSSSSSSNAIAIDLDIASPSRNTAPSSSSPQRSAPSNSATSTIPMPPTSSAAVPARPATVLNGTRALPPTITGAFSGTTQVASSSQHQTITTAAHSKTMRMTTTTTVAAASSSSSSAKVDVEIMNYNELREMDLKCPYAFTQLINPLKNTHPKFPCIHHICEEALQAMTAKPTPEGAKCPVYGCSGRWLKKYAAYDIEYKLKLDRHRMKQKHLSSPSNALPGTGQSSHGATVNVNSGSKRVRSEVVSLLDDDEEEETKTVSQPSQVPQPSQSTQNSQSNLSLPPPPPPPIQQSNTRPNPGTAPIFANFRPPVTTTTATTTTATTSSKATTTTIPPAQTQYHVNPIPVTVPRTAATNTAVSTASAHISQALIPPSGSSSSKTSSNNPPLDGKGMIPTPAAGSASSSKVSSAPFGSPTLHALIHRQQARMLQQEKNIQRQQVQQAQQTQPLQPPPLQQQQQQQQQQQTQQAKQQQQPAQLQSTEQVRQPTLSVSAPRPASQFPITPPKQSVSTAPIKLLTSNTTNNALNQPSSKSTIVIDLT